MERTWKTSRISIRKFWITLAILLTTGFLVSCVVAAVPLILKATSHKQTLTKAEVPLPAEKVHTTAVAMAKEKNLTIKKQNDKKMYLEVKNGAETISYKTEPAGAEKCTLTVGADLPAQKGEKKDQTKQREKKRTLKEISEICGRLRVAPTILKD